MAETGYLLGVDIGTSNTVAVLRATDGVTRPLLFDGQPVLPSTVYLDDVSGLLVGQDAQRMAQLDPVRCEPNPKRRIDDTSVLLGEQDIPVPRTASGSGRSRRLNSVLASPSATVPYSPTRTDHTSSRPRCSTRTARS